MLMSFSGFVLRVPVWSHRLKATGGGDWLGRPDVSACICGSVSVATGRDQTQKNDLQPKHSLERFVPTHYQINGQINHIMLCCDQHRCQVGGRASHQLQELTLLFNNNNKTLFLLFSFWSTSGLK